MVVRFTWTSGEWREAWLLSTTEQERTPGPLPMGLCFLGLTAAGGIGELLHTLRSNRAAWLQGSLLPVLLLVCALAGAALGALALVRRHGRLRGLPAVPAGEQQVTVHELGWGCAGSAGASQARVRAWAELRGQRTGRRVLLLLTYDGSTVGVPLRVLTADQESWLERLLVRKMPRPA